MNTDNHNTDNILISTRPADYLTSVLKASVGWIPAVGPLLAEVFGILIPNQRIDRVADFAQKLHDRIENREDSYLRLHLTNENFTDLLEESLQQIARSTSDERREYIANLVANGINNDDIEYIENKHLLRILGELNDVEVIWVIFYSQDLTHSSISEFRERHATVLNPIQVHMGSSQQELDQEALQSSYKLHLEREGLLRRDSGSSYNITHLGRLLVRQIGMNDLA